MSEAVRTEHDVAELGELLSGLLLSIDVQIGQLERTAAVVTRGAGLVGR
jgi:hypothetical protein